MTHVIHLVLLPACNHQDRIIVQMIVLKPAAVQMVCFLKEITASNLLTVAASYKMERTWKMMEFGCLLTALESVLVVRLEM